MSQQSDINSLSRLGDKDYKMPVERKLQSRLSHFATKKILSDTDSSSTFPYDREVHPNECYFIFFSLEGDTENTRETRDIKLSRKTFLKREIPSVDNDILLSFELHSFGFHATVLEVKPKPLTNFGSSYTVERCPSRRDEWIKGVSKDDKIQMEVDEKSPLITETTLLILEHPWSGETNLRIYPRKIIHAESRMKLSIYSINPQGEKRKQFDVPLEMFSFPFRVDHGWRWRPIKVPTNHKVIVYINSDDELQQLFQVFRYRENFTLSLLSLFLQQINFTADEIEKWDKLKCKVQRLRIRFELASVHVFGKILDKIGPVSEMQLNIESLSNYVDSPFQTFIPFKSILEQMVHLEDLENFDISDLTTPILMDYFWLTFKSRTARFSLKFVDFSNVSLHFSSLIAVECFSEAFRQLRQLKSSTLRMRNATISIENVDKNANLILLMALTSDFFEIEQIARIVKNKIASYEDKNQTQKLQYVCLSFKKGLLEDVDIEGTVTASSCENLLKFCRSWRFPSTVKRVYCDDWKKQCSNLECTKCSALLFLLAIKNPEKYKESNRRYNETFVKTVRLNFVNTKFSIANVDSLACQVQNVKETVDEASLSELTALSLPYLNIEFSCSEPRSRITESLAHSLCMLSDSGIEVDSLEISVELDEKGWGYMRIPPMDREVRIVFSNKVEVTFPLNSLKNMTSIEVHTICSDFIKRECNLDGNITISVTPIVSICQRGSNEFTHPIKIEVPITKMSEGGTKRLFFCRFSHSSVWESLQQSKLIELFSNRFRYKSEYAATVFSISGKEVDTLLVSDFCKNYFSSFCYLLVYPATQHNTLVLDCVPSTDEFELNPLKVNPFFEMKKIGKLEVNDRITGFIHGNIQIESREKETHPNRQHFEFFHSSMRRNFQEVKVYFVDKLLEPTGQITYQKKRNDYCETSVAFNFCIPKEESEGKQPTSNVKVCNFSSLKGTLVPSHQTCLLAISPDEAAQGLHHPLQDFEKENISVGNLIALIDITDDCSRASFTIKCCRFDEAIRNYANKKCPAFFCVQKLPVDTAEDVHVKFTGNLQPVKTTTDESCCCSIRFTDGRGSFALINTDESQEGVTKVMLYQKFPLRQKEERKLFEVEIKMYLFQKRQLKSWSTLSWKGEEKVVKRNVAACVESKVSLCEFFSRLLPEYFAFRELIVSNYSRMELAENELENPAVNSKVRHLLINLRQTNETTIDLLLRKLQHVDELSLILTDISLERSRRNVFLFKTFLQPSSLSKHLTTLTICGLQTPITVDDSFDYLKDQFDANRLHCLKFREVHLHWSSLNILEEFVNDLLLCSQKKGKFEFFVESSIATISNVDTNCNLILMLLLSSETSSCEQIQNVISSGGYTLEDRLGEETIEFLSLTYRDFVLKDLELSGIVTASSCESLTKLSRFWKVAPEVAHLTAKNLQMKCFDNRCEKGCSSLMFFLQNSHISRPEDIKYQMWNQVFFIEGMSRFNRILTQKGQEITALKTRTTVDEIKLHVQCHESRHDSLLIQHQFFSNLEMKGLNIEKLSILVDTDKSGWAFFKFHLNAIETKIEFSKKAIVSFPKNSTNENKLVCIEVHPIPDEAIKRISKTKKIGACHLSPVVFIDHAESAPFLQPVSIEVPYSSTELLVFEDKLKTIAFTKHDCEESDWQTVSETSITKSMYTIKYESKKFSPFAAVTGRLLNYLNFSYFANAYFPNCVYVTILPVDCNLRKVIFDCIKTTEAELSKMKLLIPGLEFRKFGEMSFDDRIFADLGPNLKLDNFFHRGRHEQRLQFFCPEHISNRQEYFMEKVNEDREPKGVVMYSHSTAGAEVELFHLCYSIARMQNVDNRVPVEVNRMVNADANQEAQPVAANPQAADNFVLAEPLQEDFF